MVASNGARQVQFSARNLQVEFAAVDTFVRLV
jgi:hypothetical protein